MLATVAKAAGGIAVGGGHPDATAGLEALQSPVPTTVEGLEQMIAALKEARVRLTSSLQQLRVLNEQLLAFPEAKGNPQVARVHDLVHGFIMERQRAADVLPNLVEVLEVTVQHARQHAPTTGASSSDQQA